MLRLAGGWVELADVYGACDSTTFVGPDAAYVDEYRSEFPLEADPRSDPMVVGVTGTDVLTLSPSALEARATSTGLDGFWLADRFSDEWGHWVTCHLTRVQYLRRHPLWGHRPLFIRAGLPAAFLQFLDWLAPGVERVELDAGTTVHFDRVVTSPSRMFGPPNPRWALTGTPRHSFAEPEQLEELYRDLRPLASASAGDWPRRAHISRQGYGRRHLGNRAEFDALLADRGFVDVHPERLTAAEQVAVWLRADTIAGEAGSWMFLGGLRPAGQMVVVNSDWMDRGTPTWGP